jgi:predicted PhzF superfamily epimerase YddE/YHI9
LANVAQHFYQVDAFTNEAFAGNPAAVLLLPAPLAAGRMQQFAREMNLSETAFLVQRDAGFDLRWFTPCVEVDLCGHATLASAHVLFSEGLLRPDATARFFTKSGELTAVQRDGWIEMDFPARRAAPIDPPPALLQALGASALFAGRNVDDYLVLVDSDATVRGLRPDCNALRQFGVRGVIVTAASADPRFDFVSRFFAPGAGVDEDPVTGSAHCCLAPFWAERLGKLELTGYQASARGGVVRVKARGDRVLLSGQAVTVARGELLAALS